MHGSAGVLVGLGKEGSVGPIKPSPDTERSVLGQAACQ
jgi:hypothetical protein